MNLIDLAIHGVGASDLALGIVRISAGTFFTISGYHKLCNPVRHAALEQTLTKDHLPFVKFNAWWVPSWELIGGLMLALGLFSAFSAGVLALICAVACFVDGRQRVQEFHPIDKADRLDDWLYLPEVLYILMLAVTILAGHGAYSLDAVIWG